MSYYFSKILDMSPADAQVRVTEELQKDGFGILSEIDVSATLKKKIDVDFRPYKILGACNPKLAHQALQAEDKIGLMLPCNVIVQDAGDGKTEVAAVDPVASMQGVPNDQLGEIAGQVRQRLQDIIARL